MSQRESSPSDKRTREWGEGREGDADVQAYINKTPALMSLLYDLDLLPEQHPDHESEAWDQLYKITNHWRENELTTRFRAETAERDRTQADELVAETQRENNGLHQEIDRLTQFRSAPSAERSTFCRACDGVEGAAHEGPHHSKDEQMPGPKPVAFDLPNLDGKTPNVDALLVTQPDGQDFRRLFDAARKLERLFWRERKSNHGLMGLLAKARTASSSASSNAALIAGVDPLFQTVNALAEAAKLSSAYGLSKTEVFRQHPQISTCTLPMVAQLLESHDELERRLLAAKSHATTPEAGRVAAQLEAAMMSLQGAAWDEQTTLGGAIGRVAKAARDAISALKNTPIAASAIRGRDPTMFHACRAPQAEYTLSGALWSCKTCGATAVNPECRYGVRDDGEAKR